jgi:O-antigen/teichoic acid export membrane protein
MAKEIKSLAKDTAIYGVSSILGKFLNWLLVPLYTHVLASSADYGIVTNLYSWTALLLVILTYGMETGFFRFANKEDHNPDLVYSTTMITVGITSLLFAVWCVLFAPQISHWLDYANYPEYIWMLGLSVAMDAFASIPFAYLRYLKRPIKFAAYKLLFVFLNITFNLFFLIVCPWLMKIAPQTVIWFYNPTYGVGYVFVSNILATAIQTAFLTPYIFAVKFKLNTFLLRKILGYSLPLLILGIAGIMNQTLDKILFPFLFPGSKGASELGIYGATSKIALVMLMFTQAFRYAYEPFVFAQKKDKDSLTTYSDAMKYFIIFSWLIFLGMVLYIDVFKFIIGRAYWSGLNVVPLVLVSFIFQGIYFNLSVWYKLTDKTIYGAWFSLIGTMIIVIGNIVLVPRYSYMGSAWAAFGCYFAVMVVSYIIGQRHFPINYQLKIIGKYTTLALVLFVLGWYINWHHMLLNLIFRTVLLGIYIWYMTRHDLPLDKILHLNKLFQK